MSEIKVNINKKVFNEAYLPLLFNKTRYEVIYGGAGSGKSYFVAQKLIYKHLVSPPHSLRTIVVRKTKNTLRDSAFEQLKSVISDWNVEKLFDIPSGKGNRLDIECKNGNRFLFFGMDNREKVKSLTNPTDMWIEEASELDENDFNQLDLRIRNSPYVQYILTFNPTSPDLWAKKRFIDNPNPKTTKVLHTTYKDNRFLDEGYRRTLENLINIDKTYYQIYAEGKFAVIDGLVFEDNWTKESNVSQNQYDYKKVFNGVDFGFNHKSALIRVGYNGGDDLYIFDEFAKSGLTNAQLKEVILERVPPSQEVIVDSAEPDRKLEFQQAGIRAVGAKKGNHSKRYGIDFLKTKRLHIHPSCQNLLNELQTFKYKQDKHGNTLDEPVEYNDDSIAALRYAVEPLFNGKTGRMKLLRLGGNKYGRKVRR